MSASKHEFGLGKRVISISRWRAGKAGVVVKVGRGATVMVRWDGEQADERMYVDALRAEIATDVAAHESKIAVTEWLAAQPVTVHAKVERGHSYSTSTDIVGVVLYRAETPDIMRMAAKELIELADWFERRPVTP